MRIAIGDQIRADAGGGLFYRGTVHSLAFGKIRIRLPSGAYVEVDQRGDHQINGKRPPDPEGALRMLKELDDVKDLSEWEKEFVGDLIQLGHKHFSPKQEEMVERIYKRRIVDA